MLLDDIFVINPVAHAYNLRPDNIQDNRYARGLRDLLLGMHEGWNPKGLGLSAEQQQTDWPVEVLAQTLFLESDVDMAAFHTLRLDSYLKDGLCRHEKTLEAVTRYPNRFLAYIGVDPTMGLDVCLREFDEQHAEIPDAVGLKMYPSGYAIPVLADGAIRASLTHCSRRRRRAASRRSRSTKQPLSARCRWILIASTTSRARPTLSRI